VNYGGIREKTVKRFFLQVNVWRISPID